MSLDPSCLALGQLAPGWLYSALLLGWRRKALSARETSELLDGDWLTSDRLPQSLPLGMSGRALGCLDFLPLFSRPLWFWRPSFFGAGPTSFGPDLSLPPNGGGLVVFTTLVELVFFDRIADRIFVPQYPSSSSRAITGSRGSCVKVVADFHKRKRLPLLKFIASPPTPASASQMQSVRPNSAPGRRWLRWLQRHGGRARV